MNGRSWTVGTVIVAVAVLMVTGVALAEERSLNQTLRARSVDVGGGATRAFYERCGCPLVATLEDFYAPGDGKAIYCKKV